MFLCSLRLSSDRKPGPDIAYFDGTLQGERQRDLAWLPVNVVSSSGVVADRAVTRIDYPEGGDGGSEVDVDLLGKVGLLRRKYLYGEQGRNIEVIPALMASSQRAVRTTKMSGARAESDPGN